MAKVRTMHISRGAEKEWREERASERQREMERKKENGMKTKTYIESKN